MCQAVSGLAPLRPELRSAGWTPAYARSWSKSVNRAMSPISARRGAAIGGRAPRIVRGGGGAPPRGARGPRRGGDREARPGRPAGRDLEQPAELGEAEFDEPDEP